MGIADVTNLRNFFGEVELQEPTYSELLVVWRPANTPRAVSKKKMGRFELEWEKDMSSLKTQEVHLEERAQQNASSQLDIKQHRKHRWWFSWGNRTRALPPLTVKGEAKRRRKQQPALVSTKPVESMTSAPLASVPVSPSFIGIPQKQPLNLTATHAPYASAEAKSASGNEVDVRVP